MEPDTGVQVQQIPVHNYGFDSHQALLDIDAVEGVGGEFAFIAGLESGIGFEPAILTFAFFTDGVAPGEYEANITVLTSDEYGEFLKMLLDECVQTKHDSRTLDNGCP